jgi:hypothetical protein
MGVNLSAARMTEKRRVPPNMPLELTPLGVEQDRGDFSSQF